MKPTESLDNTDTVISHRETRLKESHQYDMSFRATREALILSAYFLKNRGRDLKQWAEIPFQMNPFWQMQHGC